MAQGPGPTSSRSTSSDTPSDERDVALERLVGFGRHLRARGLPVGTGRVLSFCRAAAALGPFDRDDLRWAARATLVSRPEDLPSLDAAFEEYFGDRPLDLRDLGPPPSEGLAEAQDDATASGPREMAGAPRPSGDEPDGEAEDPEAVGVVASELELLRGKDFGELTEEERQAAFALIRRMALLLPLRPSRRYRAAREGERFDLRGTLRRSLRTEGEPFRRAWKRRQTRRRALVLILDVSGSMAPYSRPLLAFGHAAAQAGRRVEVFCFGTRLTRITRALQRRTPGDALAAVAETVTDWEGGTRIGDSLKQLLDEWAPRSGLRGSVVVLCSDGLERGDPGFLAAQMRRLSRLAHHVVWVNPLKGSPRYEPLARGMAASLPYVDVFLSGHNLQSLEALSQVLAAP